jgi:Mg-chelatase subunit ChlD
MPGRSGDALAQTSGLASAMQAGDRAGLVVFGSGAALERPLGERLAVASVASTISGSSTNIASALRAARSALPLDGPRRVVLLSDGLQTHGDAIAEAANSRAAGVPIDVIAPRASGGGARLEVIRVAAPVSIRAGEPVEVLVTARGKAGMSGTIALHGGDGEIRQDVTVPPAGVVDVPFVVRGLQAGVRVFEATVQSQPDDFGDGSPRSGAVVSVLDEPRVLYVSTDSSSLGRTAAALSSYDAVVLDNVSPALLTREQVRTLRQFVEHAGGGLVVWGGPDSLEAGALTANGLGDLLPIDYRPRGGQRAPSLALIIAFDKSGSMDDRVEGVPRIEFAREAVRRVFAAVPASDAVGVIAFDATPTEVARLNAGHDPRAINAGLAAIRPGGATAIAPAIEMAAAWLQDPALKTISKRHILLVSDGRTSAGDAARLRQLTTDPTFELSVVALGENADRSLLQSIAASAGGRAYFPSDIRELPTIVARESARVAGGRLVEEAFQPRANQHPILSGIDTSSLPRLGGYVVGARQPTAEAALESTLHDPILATWRLGLGRVATYSADLGGPWSALLRAWPPSRALIAQTVRWASRRVRDDALYVSFARQNDTLRVVVDAVTSDGAFLNNLAAVAATRTPSGSMITTQLRAAGPGRYESTIDATEEGPYVFTVTANDPSTGQEYRVVRGTYRAGDAERTRSGVDVDLLRRIAEVSGGRVLSDGDTPFNGPRQPQYAELRAWLVAVALGLFLAERLFPTRLGRSGDRSGQAAAGAPKRAA